MRIVWWMAIGIEIKCLGRLGFEMNCELVRAIFSVRISVNYNIASLLLYSVVTDQMDRRQEMI